MSGFSTTLGPKDGGLIALSYEAGDTTVIVLSGDLQPPTHEALLNRVAQALDRGCRHLVLDLHLLAGLDPPALEILSRVRGRVERRDGTLALAVVRDSLRARLTPLIADGVHSHRSVRAAISTSAASPAEPEAATRWPMIETGSTENGSAHA